MTSPAEFNNIKKYFPIRYRYIRFKKFYVLVKSSCSSVDSHIDYLNYYNLFRKSWNIVINYFIGKLILRFIHDIELESKFMKLFLILFCVFCFQAVYFPMMCAMKMKYVLTVSKKKYIIDTYEYQVSYITVMQPSSGYKLSFVIFMFLCISGLHMQNNFLFGRNMNYSLWKLQKRWLKLGEREIDAKIYYSVLLFPVHNIMLSANLLTKLDSIIITPLMKRASELLPRFDSSNEWHQLYEKISSKFYYCIFC